MKRSLKTILLTGLILLVVFSMACPALANRNAYNFYDAAELTSDEGAAQVDDYLYQISENLQFDVAVVTTYGTNGMNIADFADDFYDYNQYGYGPDRDGAMLVVDMQSRSWYISTHGFGTIAFTDYGIEYAGSIIANYLSNGQYKKAFMVFGDLANSFVREALEGNPADSGSQPSDGTGGMPENQGSDGFNHAKGPFNWIASLMAALGIGGGVGAASSARQKNQLKSVFRKTGAADYTRPGSMRINDNRERYLYANVIRIPRQQQNSNGQRPGGRPSHGGSTIHVSHSGQKHGGGGGHF